MTLCAVFYLVFSFLFSPSSNPPSSDESDETLIQDFVMEVAQSVAQHDITETELMILKKTQLPWHTDPFIIGSMPLAQSIIKHGKNSQTAENTDFRFTGYVELGAKRLAIINDAEYEVGEQVENSAFTVVKILFTQVELKNLENEALIVPLTETIADQNPLSN